MSDSEIEHLVEARVADPACRAAAVDAGGNLPELEDVRHDAAIEDVKQFRAAVTALNHAGYQGGGKR